MREAAVEKMREQGLKVIVVAPNYNNSKLVIHKDYILVPFLNNQKFSLLLEHIGFNDDYLDSWVEKSYKELKKIVKLDDVLFCTSGDELGTIILGYKLKSAINCKFIINFRDPIYKSKIYEKRIVLKKFNIFHVSREGLEKKLLFGADLIITSSSRYKSSLIYKYPNLQSKIVNNNFGYIKEFNSSFSIIEKKEFEIIYGGNMGKLQSPEILAMAVKNSPNIKATFIGNYKKNKTLCDLRDHINLLDAMPHEKYLKYTIENGNAGFLSLTNELSEYCVPSKLYEYINLELPILGFIKGQGKEIIEKENFGLVSDSVKELKENILKLTNPDFYSSIKHDLKKNKKKWSMDFKLNEVLDYLK